MKKNNILLIMTASLMLTITSCINDLDSDPIDPNSETSATVFNDPAAYKEALAKLYAGLAISGQQGPAGDPDISGIDEGFSTYLRQYWCAQELPTDEAINAWNDAGLPDYHNQSWSSSNTFITAMYNRIYYQISLCNEYIREVTPKLSGLTDTLATNVPYYLAEARFLRALSYYHAMDMFGNVPFVTENDAIGSFMPEQISRDSLFSYIESELFSITNDNNDIHLMDAKTNEYARVDKAAAWTLLAKMYLNSKVYLGSENKQYYTDCISYCQKVIDAGYSLHSSYNELFMADNYQCTDEIIFPVAFDGTHIQSWGGMTFIISAEIGGSMVASDYGSNQKWGGNRVTSALVNKFTDDADKRAMFYTNGQSLEISSVSTFTDGYAVTKFTNKNSDGTNGSNLTYVDTDYPVFRLPDVYLMYAEAVLRGGSGGNTTTALGYINEIRERAYGDTSGNITSSDMTLDFILDERSRELFWEGCRRTDLVRYGQLTNGTYLWPWKGGVSEGKTTSENYNLFPIPSSDIGANTNLVQNPGY